MDPIRFLVMSLFLFLRERCFLSNSLGEAINALKEEVHFFYSLFKLQPKSKISHPVFGMLNFEEWLLFHQKHAVHHLKQFGLF